MHAELTNAYPLLLALAGILFTLGLATVILRRNLLVAVMGLEVMLNAVVLSFVTSGALQSSLDGVAMTFFIYVTASCEIALAMAIVVLLVGHRRSLDLGEHQEVRG